MAKITIKPKINDKALESRLESILDAPTMLAVHNLLAKMCDPYVPFLEGPLSQTVEVHPDRIVYIQPYARRQYYGTNFRHTLEKHPKATALWDQVMLQEKGDEFNAQVKAILVRRAHELWQ